MLRNLNEHTDTISFRNDLSDYYRNGYKSGYRTTFGDLVLRLPGITSLPQKFASEIARRPRPQVVILPTTLGRAMSRGQEVSITMPKLFWTHLCQRLIESGFTPVCIQSDFCYDLSPDLLDSCLYIRPDSIDQMLSAMNTVGLGLDIFSGVNSLFSIARTPSVVLDERQRYFGASEDQFDSLFETPVERLFAFSTMLLSGGPSDWDRSFIDALLSRLHRLFKRVNNWQSDEPLTEIERFVSFEKLRMRQSKRLGVRFINPSA